MSCFYEGVNTNNLVTLLHKWIYISYHTLCYQHVSYEHESFKYIFYKGKYTFFFYSGVLHIDSKFLLNCVHGHLVHIEQGIERVLIRLWGILLASTFEFQ